MATHTPGPWRWELNLKSKQLHLCGGKPTYDLTVMDFVRWGMGNAQPRFITGGPGMNIMKPCYEFAAICPGREHHKDWFQLLRHPDSQLIEAAPDLLNALRAMVEASKNSNRGLVDARELADAAISKAEGK